MDLYHIIGKKISGMVAGKLYTGEEGNRNYFKPTFWKPMIDVVDGIVVECNTAYEGECNTTPKHEIILESHGWINYFDVDLLDENGPDLELNILKGRRIQKFVGRDIAKYDAMVLSHFKGHPMGGFGHVDLPGSRGHRSGLS